MSVTDKLQKVTLNEMRQIQLNILDKIHEYCTARQLRYSLAGGTLLGAVRHKGYIPWDDDIDIFMPRPDYEKFMLGFSDKYDNLKVQYYRNSKTTFYPFGKIYDDRTIMIETNHSKTGVYVDIFPIDGMPSDKQEADNIRNKTIDFQEALKKTLQYYKLDGKISSRIKYALKLLYYPSRSKTISDYDVLISSYPFEKSSYAGVYLTAYGDRERLKKEVFSSYVDMEFEGKRYKCIKDFDIYLSSLYGNYMELPPEDKRVSLHIFPAYWKYSRNKQ